MGLSCWRSCKVWGCKVLVYRIEDVGGKGMYWCGLWDCAVGERGDTARHPCPEDDSRLWQNYRKRPEGCIVHFHFGFASIAQLRAWLYQDEWLERMHELGGVLKVYDVDDEHVVLGNAQVMFLKERASSYELWSLHPDSIRELQELEVQRHEL